MAFTVPTFILPVDIYAGPWLSKVFRLSVLGNLSPGKRTLLPRAFDELSSDDFNQSVTLLVPKGTDVRDVHCNQNYNDIVEVPSGSGRWYSVALVEDVAKGFQNEYRIATIGKISQQVNATLYAGLFWPSPIP